MALASITEVTLFICSVYFKYPKKINEFKIRCCGLKGSHNSCQLVCTYQQRMQKTKYLNSKDFMYNNYANTEQKNNFIQIIKRNDAQCAGRLKPENM